MKYIRTKNSIYQVESVLRDNGFVKGYNVGEMAFIRKDQVIKQAETLEELCDEFVYQTGGSISKGKPMISKNDFLSLKEWYVTGGINQNNIFGAIWTSKGLIYVAKMNESGDLELI